MDRERIQRETDIEVLRRVALVLETETRVLYARVSTLRAALATARGEEGAQLELELKLLQERLAQRESELFGTKSERRGRPEGEASDGEQTASSSGDAGEKKKGKKGKKGKEGEKPQTGHGPTKQPLLPRIPVHHTLPPAEQYCPWCKTELLLKPGQFETSEEIHVVERVFCIQEHRRQKYGCSDCGHIETAPGPDKLIPGGRYSVEFAAQSAVEKYADHVPLERQVDRMQRAGLEITSQALWDQHDRLGTLLWPSYEALPGVLFQEACLGVDETWWRVMGKGPSKKWWCWTLTGEKAVYHCILPGRSVEAAKVVLRDYDGIVMADGYAVYEALEFAASKSGVQAPLLPDETPPPKLPDYLLASCWAHARRLFFQIQKHYPEVEAVLDLMGQLYAIEARAREGPPETHYRQRAALRKAESKAVTDQILRWLRDQKPIPKTGLDKAISYALNRWDSLTVFLTHPDVPLDNNHTEQALRGLVLGRKNHQGSRSERGTRVAALFYSLIETAERCGVNPVRYLTIAAKNALRRPGTVTLPWDIGPEPGASEAAAG